MIFTEGITTERGFALLDLVKKIGSFDSAKARSETEALIRQANGDLDLAYAWIKVAAHKDGIKNVLAYAMRCIASGDFPKQRRRAN